jgi:hypothetical protein
MLASIGEVEEADALFIQSNQERPLASTRSSSRRAADQGRF